MKNIVSNYVSGEAQRLREFREAESLTLIDLGKIVKKDRATISRYESGERVIPIEVVKIMNDKLGMDFNWFYLGKGERKSKPIKPTLVTDIAELVTNQSLLNTQLQLMKKELLTLHKDFHEMKNKLRSVTD